MQNQSIVTSAPNIIPILAVNQFDKCTQYEAYLMYII